MIARLVRSFAMVVALGATTIPVAHAGTILIDVNAAGRTQNQNIYGTTLSGGTATWPASASQYRDYQFILQTTAGTAVFDDFAVRLSASINNITNPSNTLRAALWTGGIVSNPDLTQALTTVTIPNSAIPSNSYATVTLTGNPFVAQTIGTSPSTFFFRIWAEGNGGNTGKFQTKVAETLGELAAVTMEPEAVIDGSIGIDTDNNGSIDTYDVIAEVPEIDPAGLGSVAALLMGALGLIERRRLKPRGS